MKRPGFSHKPGLDCLYFKSNNAVELPVSKNPLCLYNKCKLSGIGEV